MKKYLLFDLDGTLTDPKIGITTCVQYALHSFGIEEPDLDKLEPFIGPPLRDSFMNSTASLPNRQKKLWQNTESVFRIRDFLKMRSIPVSPRCCGNFRLRDIFWQ